MFTRNIVRQYVANVDGKRIEAFLQAASRGGVDILKQVCGGGGILKQV